MLKPSTHTRPQTEPLADPPVLEQQTRVANKPGETAALKPRELVQRFAKWLIRSVPTLLVLGALAAIAYLGHLNDWKLPTFAELTREEQAPTVAWCDEHGVPEEMCISCNSDLMPKGQLYGWCNVHGVAECTFEHPQLAQLQEFPVVTREDLDRASEALSLKERVANDPLCKMHLRRIQFASSEAADKAGVEIGLVATRPITETIEANGEIRYDPTRVARMASRAAGTIWSVEKSVGDEVDAGELLALVDSARVGQSKSALLQAVAQLNLAEGTVSRLGGLTDGIVAGKRLLEAKAERDEAMAAVRNEIEMMLNLGLQASMQEIVGKSVDELAKEIHYLGLPDSVVSQLDPAATTGNLMPILAPRNGVVVTRDVVAGEVIDASKTLFTIVDNRQMWLLLDVPLEDASFLKIGQQVSFLPDGTRNEQNGPITWISSQIDAETRTVKVRAELENPYGQLRDESFGAGQIVLREEASAVVAPSNAIHWEGCCHVAFVRDKNYLAEDSYKIFHTRMVRPGVTNGGYTEVIAGLFPGEVVVTDGSGVLRSELLKGNLGAG